MLNFSCVVCRTVGNTKHFRRLDFHKIIENSRLIISNYGKAGDAFVGS